MNRFLCVSAELETSIWVTVFVVIFFICFMVISWWKMAKKKTMKELWNAIKAGLFNFFDKINDFLTQNRPVETVYSDKSLNYSGTEFLPVPTKAPTDKFTFEFVGWDKNAQDEKGNFVVRAIYLQRVTKCYINVYNDDKATVLRSEVVDFGAGINLSDLKPQKPDTKEFSYEFVGWDKDLSAFYKNEAVSAVFRAVPKKYSYTFYDSDGQTILSQGTAVYGTPIICPSAPQKKSDGNCVYNFAGWRYFKDGMLLAKNCKFFAVYEKQKVETDADDELRDSAEQEEPADKVKGTVVSQIEQTKLTQKKDD